MPEDHRPASESPRETSAYGPIAPEPRDLSYPVDFDDAPGPPIKRRMSSRLRKGVQDFALVAIAALIAVMLLLAFLDDESSEHARWMTPPTKEPPNTVYVDIRQ
jgi:hypothetical protein